jgi:hypothetical protein
MCPISLILTDSVVSGFNLAHDTTPIQNPSTFLHPNQTNNTDAGLFTHDLFGKLKIVQVVAGLIYHQPYNCRKLVGRLLSITTH